MPPIYRTASHRRCVHAALAIALVAAVTSFALWVSLPRTCYARCLPWIAMFWALAPPIWFFVEYAWVFDNWDDNKAVARFKDLQAHAAKIWAGILGLLTASYFMR